MQAEAYRQHQLSSQMHKEEEKKEDIDLNPFRHYRESNIYECNGNL